MYKNKTDWWRLPRSNERKWSKCVEHAPLATVSAVNQERTMSSRMSE